MYTDRRRYWWIRDTKKRIAERSGLSGLRRYVHLSISRSNEKHMSYMAVVEDDCSMHSHHSLLSCHLYLISFSSYHGTCVLVAFHRQTREKVCLFLVLGCCIFSCCLARRVGRVGRVGGFTSKIKIDHF